MIISTDKGGCPDVPEVAVFRPSRRARLLGAGVLTLLLVTAPAATATPAPRPAPGTTFDIISDVQGDLTDLGHALGDLAAAGAAPGGLGRAHALVVNGDLVPSGTEVEYAAYTAALAGAPRPPRTLSAIGNHEYYTGEPAEVLTARFLHHTGMPAPYHRSDVNGVPVLFLGSLAAPDDTAYSRLGAEQLDWFERELDAASALPGPVLVFSHHPLLDTVSGTRGPAGAENYCCQYPRDEHDRLLQIMGDHPDVVFLTGHTHYDLGRDDWAVRRTVPGGHPDGFTAVNTGSLQTEWWTDESGTEVSAPTGAMNQGLRLRVTGGHTVIEAHDFRTDEIVNRLEITAG